MIPADSAKDDVDIDIPSYTVTSVMEIDKHTPLVIGVVTPQADLLQPVARKYGNTSSAVAGVDAFSDDNLCSGSSELIPPAGQYVRPSV